MTQEMLNDDREIERILFNDAEGSEYCVGNFGCDKISVYGEPGEHCNKPWIAIYKGDEIISRLPAGMVQIIYKLTGAEK